LQCVAVCCSVLQCVAVCCCMLQCAAVCCSVLQSVAVCCRVLQCVAVCCSVLQCVAVCCAWTITYVNLYTQKHTKNTCTYNYVHASQWQCGALRILLQCVAVRCSALQCTVLTLKYTHVYVHIHLRANQSTYKLRAGTHIFLAEWWVTLTYIHLHKHVHLHSYQLEYKSCRNSHTHGGVLLHKRYKNNKFTIQIIVSYVLWCSTIFFKNVVLDDSVLQCVAGCNVVLCCSVMCSPYACVAVCNGVRFFDLYVYCASQLS